MTNTQELAKRRASEVPAQPQVQSQSREPEVVLRPPVGIYEDEEGISLLLDMPGVSKERLTIKADRNGLLIEGNAEISTPEGMEALYAEIRSTFYRRNFSLTGELDAEKIDAKLKDGVLTIRIPKRAELRPRRIEVQSA
jgi:HSP20 family molecular chaperone IbpA